VKNMIMTQDTERIEIEMKIFGIFFVRSWCPTPYQKVLRTQQETSLQFPRDFLRSSKAKQEKISLFTIITLI